VSADPDRGEGPLLAIRDLVSEFSSEHSVVRAIDGVSFELQRGEVLGVVGESGSGKSATALSILGLLPRPHGRIVSGSIRFAGRELVGLKEAELRRLRGARIAMIFQDPMSSLNPYLEVGQQLAEARISGATQSRLAFLPERHTDFIFAVFAEMWGFAGCLVLIMAYGLLVLRGFEIAASTREPRGRIVALGITTLFATQTLINLGMVTGLLPVVGIPLPFMSYGGSSMVVSLMALGLLLSVRMRQFQ